jgi:prepilin-type N-terminal cleavage/methylation domain-containing protein
MRKGFTILEVLIALAIFSIALLGMFTAVIVSQKENLSNLLREEATRILHEELNALSLSDYDSITAPNCPADKENFLKTECEKALSSGVGTISRIIMNFSFSFGKSSCMISDDSLNLKTIWMDICWKSKGKIYHTSGFTIVRKEEEEE